MRNIEVTHRERLMATRPNVYRNKKKYYRPNWKKFNKWDVIIVLSAIFLLLLSSCKTKEIVVEREVIVKEEADTTITVQPWSDEVWTIENFCPPTTDSVVERIRFVRDYKSERFATKLKYENNALSLHIKALQDTLQLRSTRVSEKKESASEVITETKIWHRWFIWSLVVNIIGLLYISNKTFKFVRI